MVEGIHNEVSKQAGFEPTLAESAESATPASLGTSPDSQPEQSESREALYADIITRNASLAGFFPLARLTDLVLRWRGIAGSSGKGAGLAGLMTGALRLFIPVVLTAVVGHWQGIAVWRWIVVVAVLGLMDAVVSFQTPSLVKKTDTLLRAIEKESDLRRLRAFVLRWHRVWVTATIAVSMTVIILVAIRLTTGHGLTELPIGAGALLVIILYEASELAYASFYFLPFWSLESRFFHRLFWPSPVDSLAVREELQVLARREVERGVAVTVYLVLTVVLLSFHSALLLPVAVALILIGYFMILASVIASRVSVRRIIERNKQAHMTEIQQRVDRFGSRPCDLGRKDSAEVRQLLEFYNTIRDAATGQGATKTVARVVGSLIIPTVTFLLTVVGEQYAGRLFEKILP